MKTKVVYVLSGSENGLLFEQLYISVISLKYHTPSAWVSLVMDDKTNSLLSTLTKERISQYVNDTIVVPFNEDHTPMWKSRWMKTNLRNLVSGDFLFIDLDTAITNDISCIDEEMSPLAMVADSHLSIGKHPFCSYIHDICRSVDLEIDNNSFYFNSGVIYCKDEASNYVFFEKWHAYWQLYQEKGIAIDQPSLAKTNNDLKSIVALSGEWNCQLRHGMEYFYDAKILHFLGEKQHCELGTKEYLQRVKKEGFSEYVMDRIKKPKRFLLSPAGLLCGDDLYFNYTDEYEQHKKHFFHPKAKKEQLIDSISAYKNEIKGIKRLLLRLNFYILRHLLC